MSAGDSSGSSGVYDMGSLPEDPPAYSPRDDKTYFKRGDADNKYASLPRKLSQQFTIPLPRNEFDVTFRHDQNNPYDGSFIRNNVYRKTFQSDGTPILERTKPSYTKKISKKYASGKPRYATQPILLPSNFPDAYQKTNYVKYRKVLSDRPTSPESIVESVEEDILANKLNNTRLESEAICVSKKKNSPKPMLYKKSFTQGDLSIYKDLPQTYCYDNMKPAKQYSSARSTISMMDCADDPLSLRSCSTSVIPIPGKISLKNNPKNKLATSISTTTFFSTKVSKNKMMMMMVMDDNDD